MAQIIIQLQGGLVQDVFLKGTNKITKVIVVNEDDDVVMDARPDEITSVKLSNKRTYEACIHTTDINILPKGSDVDRIVAKYLNG